MNRNEVNDFAKYLFLAFQLYIKKMYKLGGTYNCYELLQ